MKREITDAVLHRFFAGQSPEEETDMITAWLNEDPDAHQKIFDEAYRLYAMGVMYAPDATIRANRTLTIRSRWMRIMRYAGSMAAALLVGFVLNYTFFNHRTNEWLQQQTSVEVPAGQHIRLTLGDGSVVELNAQSRLVYPSVFGKGERRVKLEGEAIFEVAHDAEHPFVVETFAYDVKVLGTHFDVTADESENCFSTALFSGSVAISNRRNDETVILRPDDIASLRNGRLFVRKIENQNDYLWMDGIVSIGGIPFDRLMAKLERSYGVKIEIRRSELPTVKYKSLKVRVSDGIDHALKMLQLASDFTYEYDTATNTIIIK